MTDKERLYIKLLIFSLKRTKEFILSQYDDVLAVQMSISGQEDFYMLTFCFKSLDPDFLGEAIINTELKACYRRLIQKMKQIRTSRELYKFAKSDIDSYLLILHACVKR